MRCLVRNMVTFYYAPYEGKNEITDEYGNVTGQYEVVYGNPVKMMGNISASVGEIQNRQFGDSENYDKVIALGNPNTPIDEYSVLWVDKSPSLNNDGSLTTNASGEVETPHDYIVKRVARSLNYVSIAISKVNVK